MQATRRPQGGWFGDLGATLERRADGALLIRSDRDLEGPPVMLTAHLDRWAGAAPLRTFLAKRIDGGGWRCLSYRDAARQARTIAGHLMRRPLSAERPIAILSGNDIEHALLTLAAMYAGIPVAPISPAYALLSSDFAKLRDVLAQLAPGLIFVDDTARFANALAVLRPGNAELVATTARGRPAATPFAALLEPIGDAAAAACSGPGLDAVAKILFTSGSTGTPKGVITTHRMLATNQAMLRHWLPGLLHEPPVLVDWLPWHHTFGGSHNLGLVLANGGTLYIDDGKPTSAGIAETVRNLRDVAPTLYFNVPKGYEELLDHLGSDAPLREKFFSRLRLTFSSGASLPRHLSDALDRLAAATIGATIPMVTGFGSTETAPACVVSTPSTSKPGNIGVPLPGVTLKLVPSGGKLEARVKGANVTPGYWRDPDRSRAAFDAEGFYLLGDALRFAVSEDPAQGFEFDGRIAEDFKLGTGTWVSVGPLRLRLLAGLAPMVRDAVIAGHDRGDVTALIFPDLVACRRLLGSGSHELTDAAVLAAPAVRAAVADRLSVLARSSTGSSNRVVRVVLLDEPPSIDAGEITDKGSINQRAVLARRARIVDELYAAAVSDRIIHAR